MLGPRFSNYRAIGRRFVSGWADAEVFDIIHALDVEQRAARVVGAIAEIGVHHGKLFIGLHLLRRPDEHSLAIDLFEAQHLNADKSGRGDLGHFLRNVDRWASREGLVVHQGDSTRLTGAQVTELVGAPVRLFSVDGGHTEEIVVSDMQVAEGALAEGGIVIGDDVFNENWPGVAVGTVQYMQTNQGALAPFAIGFNKVLFAQRGHCDKYRDALERYAGSHTFSVGMKRSVYAGHDVVVLYRVLNRPVVLLKNLLRRSAAARVVYKRIRH